ncbi:MAG: transcriptional regulator NrdR [Candidatus Micrarchaeota archaeon]|nr:transcriptional regulator NrdR [Candidatus Micrarchaeota archaeon]MDE1834356.1 transcriptional regulator NrdR [Candidatus Micrarchaeota archaeon]MDE1859706.1 transcriptional regulator NrdR [Candidatus Micrarchaeota archaeon]
MKCPFCASGNTEVIDSREVMDGESIRRRRQCESCKKRFTTYERVEAEAITVIKRDATRQPFDKSKILNAIMKASAKRNISREKMDGIVDKIEMKLRSKGIKEIESRKIGDMVVKELFSIDPVAYIRFASVYYNFDSPEEFRKYVSTLEKAPKRKK